jgi:glycosyltransferase involved in cell wall biosynthesis
MKIAIISFNHPESTIALAKHLASENTVDYYFITSLKSVSTSAFEFTLAPKKMGIVKLEAEMAPEAFSYIGSANAKLHLIRLVEPFLKLSFLNNIIIKNVCSKIIKEKYDAINIIGQNDMLLKFHKDLLPFKNITHTLHEVASHYAGQTIGDNLISFLVTNDVKIIVHSDVSLKRMIERANGNNLRIKKINFGLFESYLNYDKNNIPHVDENILLFYGFIRPYKGLDVLSDALDKVKDKIKDFKVIIAGGGHDPILNKLKENPLCVVLNKHLSNQEIVDLNRRAKVVVCPYKSASQSGIILTTFLFGKPIIASRVGGFSEIIEDNVNGILVNPSNPEELSNAIISIFNSTDLYQKLVKGVESFKDLSTYNWQNIASETVQFIEGV